MSSSVVFTEFPSVEEQIYRQSVGLPDKAALIDAKSGEEVSFSRLWHNIIAAAARFQKLGLVKGNRVILSASKSVDFVYTYFGAHMAGIIVVPVDSEINYTRLERIVGSTAPKAIIGEITNHEELDVISFDTFNAIDGAEHPRFQFPAQNDIADILFTTGTTGTPKGVTLSFLNETAAASNINSFIGNSPDDVELLALPISHSFGLGRLRCMLSIGATVVILGSFASMKKFFGAIENFGVTGFGMVPASWAYISKMSGGKIGNFAKQLKYIEIGSAAMPISEKERLISLLPNTEICMHYGLTEASRSSFLNLRKERSHLNSAGKASPNCELAIFSQNGERLGIEVDGEVCVRGAHVCSGYWNDSNNQYCDDFFEGFFRTGDWGCLDSDGYLLLKSRTKEMINVGGKKVSPMEVEEIIESYPGVAEAACIGKEDSVMGEVVKAFIVSTKPIDISDLANYLSKRLENYKVPAEFVLTDSLPRTSSGKLQRLSLKNF